MGITAAKLRWAADCVGLWNIIASYSTKGLPLNKAQVFGRFVSHRLRAGEGAGAGSVAGAAAHRGHSTSRRGKGRSPILWPDQIERRDRRAVGYLKWFGASLPYKDCW